MKAPDLEPVPPGGVSAATFARRLGVSDAAILRYCKLGRIFGARKHVLTGKWWIYPPAKLLLP